ncbi:unnamed protein product [Dracunculus medinensis]|uniref:ADP,ATP carrier protein n=1 Tax=Dracunculus medinensis TaxID=318479 RepID=A0A0N4U491_DRAME|nr:unnamed protein product [Dracunculus medinensis]
MVDLKNCMMYIPNGIAGVLAGHPLDTVKVQLQTQAPGQYTGTIHCFRSIIKNEGIAGLFKGISSLLATLSFTNAIIFGDSLKISAASISVMLLSYSRKYNRYY